MIRRAARRTYDLIAAVWYELVDLAYDIAAPMAIIAGLSGFAYLLTLVLTCR